MRILPDWAGYCQFRSAFADVMDDRYHSLDWLDAQVLSGEFTFFRTEDAAIVVEVRDYPTGAKDVHGLIAAGNLQDIVEQLIPAAEAWGKGQGCIGAIIESREGWSKTLKNSGYQPHQLALRKEL